jgi:hypothetical protein
VPVQVRPSAPKSLHSLLLLQQVFLFASVKASILKCRPRQAGLSLCRSERISGDVDSLDKKVLPPMIKRDDAEQIGNLKDKMIMPLISMAPMSRGKYGKTSPVTLNLAKRAILLYGIDFQGPRNHDYREKFFNF